MIEKVKKIASMVWAFGLNRQMEAEGKPVRFSPEDFWEQKLINKNPYFDFTQQICNLEPKGDEGGLIDTTILTLPSYITNELNITEELKAQRDLTASEKDTEYQEIMKQWVKFRKDLRNLLGEHKVYSSLGWTEQDIVNGFKRLIELKDAKCQARVERIFREIEDIVDKRHREVYGELVICPVKWQALKEKELG